ncbi:CaiB/BaiF CoA transferase family protein [Brevibacterium album]|uniref:CaiB/BaiF CoA transferase family protein n=1 Tax=Brevibacterium album TaxID=417948 RepID=UPI0009FE59F9|nr:CoA transferase [Brevibacterium album]
MSSGPLSGLFVVDLTRFVSGPYCTMLMADAGATVVKVEPLGGDPARRFAPLFPLSEGGISATFMRMNRGKLSVEIDLKDEKGRGDLVRLIRRADVLVENFRAGALARLGFDEAVLEELNPGLIYASISGFGHSPSQYRDRPAFNLIAEYEAGVYRRGDNGPEALGPYVGDLFPGLHALSGILMALFERARTGVGTRVDISMFDSMLSLNEAAGSNGAWLGGEDGHDAVNFHCPSGVYSCEGGFVCIDVVTDRQWSSLCAVMGAPDLAQDVNLASGAQRAEAYGELLAPVLLPWLEGRTAAAVVELLTSNGIPAAVVRSPADALMSAQAGAREMRIEVSRQGAGAGLPVAANPIRVGDHLRPTSARIADAGEHSSTVLGSLSNSSGSEEG